MSKMVESKTQTLNTDFFELIIGQQSLTNEYYLSIIVDHINTAHYNNPGVRLIMRMVKDFFHKRAAVPKASEIRQYLHTDADQKLFVETLRSFKNLDQGYNLDELIANTERFLKERAIWLATKETVEKYSDSNNKFDPNHTLGLFSEACNISLIDNVGFDYFNQIDRHIADLKELAEYIPTGWKWIDEKLSGGLLKTGRALYVIAGPTNVGKSIVLGNIAVNVAKTGKTVLIVSLEMSEAVYGKRVSSQLSQIPLSELSTQTETLKNFLLDYKSKNGSSKIIIKEFPPKGITVNHLKAYVQKLIHKGVKPDVIVLDYLNLMEATGGDNSYTEVKGITEQLRALTYIFRCPIVSATQVNRCIDINALVTLADGNQIKIKDLKNGDALKSNNGDVIVKHVYPVETQKTYKIKLKSGKSIIVSGKHLFPTNSGKFLSIDMGLKKGMKLLSLPELQ